jgi:LmbE family N-acetylglucosaminyl deacetylase
MNVIERLLVLAPHTDDAELGCGGTIARLLEAGTRVHVATFSTAEGSLPPGSPPDRLKLEFIEAMQCLGIPPECQTICNYPVRRLNSFRQEVLEELIVLGREFRPDAVFLPSCSDLHQDHQVVSEEGLRAFKHLTVLGYELPWNHIAFSAGAFVTLTAAHLAAKWRALACYSSQVELGRPYFTRAFIESLALVRGTQVKVPLAEAFEIIRFKF